MSQDSRADEQLSHVYARLFSTPDGQKVLADLEAKHFNGVIDGDATQLAIQVGRREVVRIIKSRIEEAHGG